MSCAWRLPSKMGSIGGVYHLCVPDGSSDGTWTRGLRRTDRNSTSKIKGSGDISEHQRAHGRADVAGLNRRAECVVSKMNSKVGKFGGPNAIKIRSGVDRSLRTRVAVPGDPFVFGEVVQSLIGAAAWAQAKSHDVPTRLNPAPWSHSVSPAGPFQAFGIRCLQGAHVSAASSFSWKTPKILLVHDLQ
jgi:hypothetical protein